MVAHSNERFVLIVEDDALLAKAWQGTLSHLGYEVAVCSHIENGLETCKTRWPDLIILDGFFLDNKGIPRCEGAAAFCTAIAVYAVARCKPLPPIIGVTGVRPHEDFPTDVFSAISLDVMPTRMRKPLELDVLAYEVNRALA